MRTTGTGSDSPPLLSLLLFGLGESWKHQYLTIILFLFLSTLGPVPWRRVTASATAPVGWQREGEVPPSSGPNRSCSFPGKIREVLPKLSIKIVKIQVNGTNISVTRKIDPQRPPEDAVGQWVNGFLVRLATTSCNQAAKFLLSAPRLETKVGTKVST